MLFKGKKKYISYIPLINHYGGVYNEHKKTTT